MRELSRLNRQLRETARTRKPFDIAVSYVADDSAIVDPIVALLRLAGLRIFDYRDEDVEFATIGIPLDAVLRETYGGKAEICVAFISPGYLDSPIASKELEFAAEHAESAENRYLIPVLIQACEVPKRIETLVYLKPNSERPEDVASIILKSVLERLASLQAVDDHRVTQYRSALDALDRAVDDYIRHHHSVFAARAKKSAHERRNEYRRAVTLLHALLDLHVLGLNEREVGKWHLAILIATKGKFPNRRSAADRGRKYSPTKRRRDELLDGER